MSHPLSYAQYSFQEDSVETIEDPYEGLSKNAGPPFFGSPHSKDHNILGSVLGPLTFGDSRIRSFDRGSCRGPRNRVSEPGSSIRLSSADRFEGFPMGPYC